MDERPWFKSYDPTLPRTLRPYPEKTILDVIGETVRERPDHPALIFKGARMTYAELAQLTDAFGAALVAQGVKKGDRVALLLPNSPQAVIAQVGAWKAGAIVSPLNALYTERELEYALNEMGAETVVVLTPFYAKIKALQPRTQIKRVIATNIKEYLPPVLRLLFTVAKEKKEGHRVTLQPGDLWLGDLIKQHAAGKPNVAVGPQDPALLLFSGGTTGLPKAALGTHQAIVMTALQLRAYARAVLEDWNDILTWVMPNFHVYGNMAMNCSFVARWPMAVVPNPRDIDDLVETIQKVRPSCLHGVPTLFIALLNHPAVKAGKVDFKSMKICWSAAAPLMAETKHRFEALTGGWLLEAYAHDRDDARGRVLSGAWPVQGRLDRRAAARCGPAHRGRGERRADAALQADRRDHHSSAADHGGLLGASHRNPQHDPQRLGLHGRPRLPGRGRLSLHCGSQEGPDQAGRLSSLAA